MLFDLNVIHTDSDLLPGQDSTVYQMAFTPEIEGRLQLKCEKLTAVFEADEAGSLGPETSSNISFNTVSRHDDL